MSSPNGANFLHKSLLDLGEGERRAVSFDKATDPGRIGSWIVLTGRLLMELQQGIGAKSMILDAGNVLHAQRNVSRSPVSRLRVRKMVSGRGLPPRRAWRFH